MKRAIFKQNPRSNNNRKHLTSLFTLFSGCIRRGGRGVRGEVLLILVLLCVNLLSNAQGSGVPVEILQADRMTLQKIGDSTNLTILEGNVVMKQGKTIFKCNRCVKNDRANTFEAWGKVHINDSDTTDVYADHLRYLTDKEIAYLDGNVKLTDGNAVLTTPSAEYNMATNIATYKNGGKVVNKKTVITSKAANYYTDIKDVIFMKDVKVNDPAYNIVTDSLLYNTDNQVARFITYTVIRDSANRKITTREGFYNLRTGDAEFAQRTMVNDDNKTTIIADSLTLTEEFAQAKGQAVVVDSVRKTIIIADLIYQNRLTEAVLATRNPLMIIRQDNDSIYITADTLFSAKLTDLYSDNPVTGDSLNLHSDSLQSNPLVAPDAGVAANMPGDSILNRQVDSLALATKPAIAGIAPPVDSIANRVNADSVQNRNVPPPDIVRPAVPAAPGNQQRDVGSGRDSARQVAAKNTELLRKKNNDNDSTNRYFEAFHNVRIFSDSMQARSDSLFYSFKDSVFRLYQDPVVWSKGSQITADTLLMHTKNKQPHWLEAIDKGFMISHLEQEAFNQVKSSRIDGFFTNGNLDSVRAKGSAEAVYYMQDDDSAYTGVNQSTGDIIDAYIHDRQLKKVVLRGRPRGTIYPIRQKNPKEMQLQGFNWREAERPKTKYDLLQ